MSDTRSRDAAVMRSFDKSIADMSIMLEKLKAKGGQHPRAIEVVEKNLANSKEIYAKRLAFLESVHGPDFLLSDMESK